ncbi:hypothetical protein GCM10027449_33070 [Sinomonas notoginsengisoli]|uniref:hypothetical protein n=1 Tax=Sinomonas notoginsengisoli TaxID=1457311 RepID=UPI001F21E192|nr:hypothetical protein [Sinomonas notoginsengisoli]
MKVVRIADVERVDRPSFENYDDWLDQTWHGDKRELRPGRFLHHQADLKSEFEQSEFWLGVQRSLPMWEQDYAQENHHRLFSGTNPAPLNLKPWKSFLNKTWRENVKNNANWPDAPNSGWVLPDTWFEKFWDIIRTRFTVNYLDGVSFLVERIERHAKSLGLQVQVETKAKDTGYYAMHVRVPQEFKGLDLDYVGPELRTSEVEIQVTTALQEMVDNLTHRHFERSRETMDPVRGPWQWDYRGAEFGVYYLGHVVHWVEGMIMAVRDTQISSDGKDDIEA